MEGSRSASREDGPESWEVADVDASMRRLMFSSRKEPNNDSNNKIEVVEGSITSSNSSPVMPEELINTVDQFVREAIQNPRERLSVLRMEQDVEKFIKDSNREQMEFQQLPTSYLQLAAHRVAQHYSLQSMVLLDNNLPYGSGSRIIVRKTSSIRLPLVRLADIPVNLPIEDGGSVKLAIKQRSHQGSQSTGDLDPHSIKSKGSKSVEERKEEYNRARARIFNSDSSGASSTGKPESEAIQGSLHHLSSGLKRPEERTFPGGGLDVNIGRSLLDSSAVSSRLPRSRAEKEPICRPKTNNRVAIFRDREIERKDPDYDRSYDRYMQRFDPGFGFSGGAYTVQPMYTPTLNYNTEFPQLGSNHRPTISAGHQFWPLPQHLPGPWAVLSTPACIGYGPSDNMFPPFTPGHLTAPSNAGLYLRSTLYPYQQTRFPYVHPLEPVNQPFPQSHQLPDASFGLARPR